MRCGTSQLMQAIIYPSSVHGTVQASASKSMSQRAIAAALLANGRSTLRHITDCNDVQAALNIACTLGAKICCRDNELLVDGGFNPSKDMLNCRESGLCMRMFAPIVALHGEMLTMTGEGSLLKRPLGGVEAVFTQLGISCTTHNGFLPLTLKGPLRGGSIRMDASLTSQLLTGLLMALPLAANDSEIEVLNLKSKPYIDMTIALLSQFGIKTAHNDYSRFQIKGGQKYVPTCYTVEGDWSGAAFLLVAGAFNGNVSVTNLSADSFQADKLICEALQLAGAHVYMGGSCEVKKNELQAFHFDAGECPDLVPPLAALAAHCKGTTFIRGAKRLKHKESNRAAVLQEEFAKLGVKIVIQEDVMMIEGGIVQGGAVHAHNDHRIAMALATAAVTSVSPVTIEGADCINKSYPNFFHDLKTLNIHCHYE